MIKSTLLVLSALVLSQSALASGGFDCSVQTFSGDKYGIAACLPHGVDGLCSDVRVTKNGRALMTIPSKQKTANWSDLDTFLLKMLDADFSNDVLVIKYYGEKNANNRLELTVDGRTLRFKDVECSFE